MSLLQIQQEQEQQQAAAARKQRTWSLSNTPTTVPRTSLAEIQAEQTAAIKEKSLLLQIKNNTNPKKKTSQPEKAAESKSSPIGKISLAAFVRTPTELPPQTSKTVPWALDKNKSGSAVSFQQIQTEERTHSSHLRSRSDGNQSVWGVTYNTTKTLNHIIEEEKAKQEISQYYKEQKVKADTTNEHKK